MQVQLQTNNDVARFDELAQVIDEGMFTVLVVGNALREMKDKELWKLGGYESFEKLVDDRWGWTKRYANQIIVNAEVINGLPVNMRKLLASGSSQKEMAKIPESLRPAVLLRATQNGKRAATAAAIKKAGPPPRKPGTAVPVKKGSAPPPRKKSGPKPAPTPEPGPTFPTDFTGCEIPTGILPLWERAGDAQELIAYVAAALTRVEKVQAFGDPLFITVDYADTIAKLKQVKENLREAKPYAVCATCGGKTPEDCRACKGRGFVSEFFWNNCVPDDVKALRKPK